MSTGDPLRAAVFPENPKTTVPRYPNHCSPSCPSVAPVPSWFNPCVHPAERTTCPKASGMEIAHSSGNAQFHPVLKPPLKKNSSECLWLQSFHLHPFPHLSEPFVFHPYNTEEKKGRKKVIDTLTDSEWAFFPPSGFISFPPPALHILSSPALFFCKYP